MSEKIMPRMTLENIARACEGTYVGDMEHYRTLVTGIVIDSRKVEPGNVFVAIKGARVDGHDLIPSVYEQGAICCISEKALANPVGPYIIVDSTQEALKAIAAFYRRCLNIKVVGVTGSVGKTSTKEMISSVLAEKYSVLKTAGNFNNEIGLPLTVFNIRDFHQVAVLEMGISDFNEMHRLANVAEPDICVITNIGMAHLENLGTRDGILKAKTESFEHMTANGVAILNGDDDKLCTQTIVNGKPATFYGINHEAALDVAGKPMAEKQIYATDVEHLGFEGNRVIIHTPEGEFEVVIPIPGDHNVYNALAATAVGRKLGLTLDEIKAGIEKARTIAGRTNLLRLGDGIMAIDDCYNANPVSMEASLDVLSHAKGRKIAVLGDMGELGTEEKALHYKVGKVCVDKNIDVLFAAGELSAEYERAIKDANGTCDVHYFAKREDMTEDLLNFVEAGDSILIKASHFMEFPAVVRALEEKFR